MAFLGFLTSRAAARGHAALQPDGLAAAEQAAVAAVGVRVEAPAVTVGGGVALDPFVAKVRGKGLGWPKRCKLAHAFLQEYS